MKKLLVMGLMLLSMTADAASLLVGGFSYHITNREYNWNGNHGEVNEVNPMVGFEYEGYSLSVMNNSYNKTSVVVGKDFLYEINNTWAVGVKVGVATGYKETPINLSLAPYGQAQVEYTSGRLTTVVGFMPPVQAESAGVFTLHWKWKL